MARKMSEGIGDVNTDFWTFLGLTELDIYKFHCRMQEGQISKLKEQVEALQRDKRVLQWQKVWSEQSEKLLKAAYDELWEAIPEAEIIAKDRALSGDELQF